MSAWVLLGIGLYVLVEWLVASWLATLIGWGGVVLVVLVLVIVGSAVMRRAGASAFRSLRPVQVDGVTVTPGSAEAAAAQVGRDMSDAGSLFVAGMLIAVPGLVTSVVGLVLLVRPVRRAASGALSRWARRRAERAGLVMNGRVTTVRTTVVGDVVREDVVQDDVPGSRPVRGEIISGEIVREDRPDA